MFHSFPFIIPFFPVKIPNGTYYLGQDLQLIDSAIVPSNPIVPNHYNLLSIITPETSYLSVLQLYLIFYSSGPLSQNSFAVLVQTWTCTFLSISCWQSYPKGFSIAPIWSGSGLWLTLFVSSKTIQHVAIFSYVVCPCKLVTQIPC